jgi:hypothetical protein
MAATISASPSLSLKRGRVPALVSRFLTQMSLRLSLKQI